MYFSFGGQTCITLVEKTWQTWEENVPLRHRYFPRKIMMNHSYRTLFECLGHPNCLEHWGRDVAASRDTAAFFQHRENFKASRKRMLKKCAIHGIKMSTWLETITQKEPWPTNLDILICQSPIRQDSVSISSIARITKNHVFFLGVALPPRDIDKREPSFKQLAGMKTRLNPMY